MEKRTILAVVLSMVVMIGFFMIQTILYPPPDPAMPPSGTAAPSGTENVIPVPAETRPAAPEVPPAAAAAAEIEPAGETVPLQEVVIENEVMRAVLSNAGGNISSFRLKNHFDNGEPVEMILAGNEGSSAFAVAFGSRDDVLEKRIMPVTRNFRVRKLSDLIVEFSQDFGVPSGGVFTMVKRYEFKPAEYMFELTIALNGGNSVNAFDFGGASYTLFYGPQIGPAFVKLDQRYEYRNYLSYRDKLKNERVNEREPTVVSGEPSWAAIVGKYFTLIALPYASPAEVAFSARPELGVSSSSRLLITRPASTSSRVEDKYQFYLGPKNQESLDIYERGTNEWKLRETGLINAADTRGFLAPLEKLLKWCLVLFHKIIPNYGIAIILLTILVKLAMFPLTRKGSESTQRMQTLSPKIKEIQAKYKDNPQRMNTEMAEFYKKEGYNPLSGCLPMIIQIPIFFAMYNLFNNHFDLRGAVFIPGWIPDLSHPEAIYNFPDGFRLPLLGWTAIRLLPFIYVGSQLLYGKVTQTPDQQGNTQMKLMLYAMPIVFFFILYDVPSGLLLYWIMSNILTMVQQVVINKYLARKKAAAAAVEPAPIVVPAGKRKKKKQ